MSSAKCTKVTGSFCEGCTVKNAWQKLRDPLTWQTRLVCGKSIAHQPPSIKGYVNIASIIAIINNINTHNSIILTIAGIRISHQAQSALYSPFGVNNNFVIFLCCLKHLVIISFSIITSSRPVWLSMKSLSFEIYL